MRPALKLACSGRCTVHVLIPDAPGRFRRCGKPAVRHRVTASDSVMAQCAECADKAKPGDHWRPASLQDVQILAVHSE